MIFIQTQEWEQLRREAYRQGTATATCVTGTYYLDEVIFTGATKEAMGKGYITDWEKIMFRNTVLQKHDLSARMEIKIQNLQVVWVSLYSTIVWQYVMDLTETLFTSILISALIQKLALE